MQHRLLLLMAPTLLLACQEARKPGIEDQGEQSEIIRLDRTPPQNSSFTDLPPLPPPDTAKPGDDPAGPSPAQR
ncbi:hypothetical protein CAP39_02930 [Sphingomonas sp. IBVSS1]|nr:hypothetical protein CAP39_02930 [Sphingomonas sp. IBVSS1]